MAVTYTYSTKSGDLAKSQHLTGYQALIVAFDDIRLDRADPIDVVDDQEQIIYTYQDIQRLYHNPDFRPEQTTNWALWLRRQIIRAVLGKLRSRRKSK